MSETGAPKNDEALRCPRCAFALQETRAGDNIVLGCETCGGAWIDHETLARVGKSVSDARVLASRVAIRGRARVPGQTPIACPVCTTPLRRARVESTEVDVDYCAAHGTWLDWGEIYPFIVPRTDTTQREFTVDELEAADEPASQNSGFFAKLARLISRA